ncbi:hypothetical protein JK635_07520 [Neobacillus sp. YIM B02564]|uniref:Uncharacterized protein n=1 Tax=Neobacillus paridis TaxID=2803862 RepID=A0ABS1TL68_9BACI|nr:hypothetical protein [Neobacillus paridis]MBL4952058.1 hypothetical protein [Neobacillus paridis]
MVKEATIQARVTQTLKERLTKALQQEGLTESDFLVNAATVFIEKAESKHQFPYTTQEAVSLLEKYPDLHFESNQGNRLSSNHSNDAKEEEWWRIR